MKTGIVKEHFKQGLYFDLGLERYVQLRYAKEIWETMIM